MDRTRSSGESDTMTAEWLGSNTASELPSILAAEPQDATASGTIAMHPMRRFRSSAILTGWIARLLECRIQEQRQRMPTHATAKIPAFAGMTFGKGVARYAATV